MVRVIAAAGCVIAVSLTGCYLGGGDYKTGCARHDMQGLQRACEVYRQTSASGKEYPAGLDEVVSLMDQGQAALLDPWGNPYRYAVAKDATGRERAYIWCEREVNGRTRVIGETPPEP